MFYTVVANWGWVKHEDCRNAYSIHDTDCNFVKTRNNTNSQGVWGKFLSVENAIADSYDNATERFDETLSKFGFWHMVTVCKCAGGAAAKKNAKQIVKVGA
jgi:hypothetical protein